MGFGVKDTQDAHVPGTALLDDLHKDEHRDVDHTQLKKGSGRNSHIVLVPQPTDDPNDPYNWPRWKKEALFWVSMYMCGLAGGVGPILASGFLQISQEWGVSIDRIAGANGYGILMIGISMGFSAVFGQKYGRRPVMLAAVIFMIAGGIWAPLCKGNVNSWIGSRVLQGLGIAPFEALVTNQINDMFFVHERGFRITIWSFMIQAGVVCAPLVNGYIISSPSLGWEWCYWIMDIALVIGFFGVFFFMPETKYLRPETYRNDNGHVGTDINRDDMELKSPDQPKGVVTETETIGHLEKRATSAPSYGPKNSYLSELKPWSGFKNPKSIASIAWSIVPMCLSPVVLTTFSILAFGQCWSVILSTVSSVIFAKPPLLFNATQTGLMNIAPLIGFIVAVFVAGPLIDWFTVFAARRNAGIFEPEFRLILILPGGIVAVAAYAGWAGFTATDYSHWIGPAFFFGLINVLGSGLFFTAIVVYINEVHRDCGPEAFAAVNLTKGVLIFGFVQFVGGWVQSNTTTYIMSVLCGVQFATLLFAIPMYRYGKQCRLWMAKHPKIFATR